MKEETLPEPDGYYYEWDGPYGKRKFTPAPHNGSQCDRAVAYYTVATLRKEVKRARREALAEARVAVIGEEFVHFSSVLNDEDRAYNQAIGDAAEAIRKLLERER